MPFMVPEVSAYTGVHDETFIDDTFIDELETNVTGVGTGEIMLPTRGLDLMGQSDYFADAGIHALEIAGDFAYISIWNEIHIYNISDVMFPYCISTIETP